MKYETFCPMFPGFYGTVFEYDSEENEIEYYNEENGTDLGYDDFEWNYTDYHERVSKAFVNKLESELKGYLPISINYQRVSSPREYNFYNDHIDVEISLSLDRLIKLVKERKEDASGYFTDHYTSCSGFISFHSNDINDWLKKSYILDKPEHRIGALLDCFCELVIDKDDTIYWADSESWIDFHPKETVNS